MKLRTAGGQITIEYKGMRVTVGDEYVSIGNKNDTIFAFTHEELKEISIYHQNGEQYKIVQTQHG